MAIIEQTLMDCIASLRNESHKENDPLSFKGGGIKTAQIKEFWALIEINKQINEAI